MDDVEKLMAIREYVHTIFNDDSTGHDFFHMQRVARIAKSIAEKEDADLFICEAAAWVHDVGDRKLFSNVDMEMKKLNDFFRLINCTPDQIDYIYNAVTDVSFSKSNTPVTLEGKIVQDADRLDAIGAIGIARTFAYGGSKGQLIWHDNNQEDTSIQHFYDKLLHLKELMHTRTAKEIANERHLFTETYLNHFFNEWKHI